MAQQKGILQLSGSLEDLVFYYRLGKPVVRRKARISRQQRLNAPNYAPQRNHAKELGLASRIAKAYRMTLPTAFNCSDATFTGRLTAAFKKVISMDNQPVGKRSFLMHQHTNQLKGFRFHQDIGLHYPFKENISIVHNQDTFECLLHMENYELDKLRNSSSSPLDLSLWWHTVAISDVIYDIQKEVHSPVGKDFVIASSTTSQVVDSSLQTLQMTQSLSILPELENHCGLLHAFILLDNSSNTPLMMGIG